MWLGHERGRTRPCETAWTTSWRSIDKLVAAGRGGAWMAHQGELWRQGGETRKQMVTTMFVTPQRHAHDAAILRLGASLSGLVPN